MSKFAIECACILEFMAFLLPQTIALDFDGIICDGLLEYFQTAWQVYRTTWPTSNSTPPKFLAETFYRLRPVVGTGWEMPILLRAAIKGFSETSILEQWPSICTRIVAEEDLNLQNIGHQVDAVRDRWIQQNLEEWLELHHFYPGVIAQLQRWQAAGVPLWIITTKESRFVVQLLATAGVTLPSTQIYGKDSQQPKPETLRQLQGTTPLPIWFVEDRLATLQKIKTQDDLKDIGLFLGDWGYNTPRDRHIAQQDERITLITLAQFQQEFTSWT
nr:HAD family hydrolase [Petrachloros mirabilis]